MRKYIIGVDNGSQSTKVSIFDLKGREVAFGSWKLKENLTPEPGRVVHPDDDLWDSIQIAIKKCLNNFDGNKNDIIGMGICTIRCCRALLKEDGSLAQPIISWMDVRMKDPYKHEDDNVKFVTSMFFSPTYLTSGSLVNLPTNITLFILFSSYHFNRFIFKL